MEANCKDISLILRISPQFRLSTHIDNLLYLTKDVQFFKRITMEQDSNDIHRECCKVMNLEEYSNEDIIFNFGDKGDKFYIILSGSVSIKIPSKKKILVSKDTVNKIEKILESDNESNIDSEEEIPETTKKLREGHVTIKILDVMNSLQFTKYLKDSETDEKQCILDTEEKILLNVFKNKVKQEQKVLMNFVKQSEWETVEVELDDFIEVGILHTGSSFGEIALISERPRSATIQVRERSSFLVLYKTDFTKILGGIAEKRMNVIIKFMQQLVYFKSWSRVSLVRIAYNFQYKKYKRNQYIYHEGDECDGIYFIKDGEITIVKKKSIRVKEEVSVFSSTPSEFLSKISRKKIKKFVDIKVVVKSTHESLGGRDIFESDGTREYGCMCTSACSEVYFMTKENFLSRVPNLDVIKEMLISEYERIKERYAEMCGIEDGMTNPTRIRSFTPKLNSIKLNNFALESLKQSLSKKHVHPIKKKPTPSLENIRSKSFLRQLTGKEVHDAINGRSALVRKYAYKVSDSQSPGFLVNQIMKRSRNKLFR